MRYHAGSTLALLLLAAPLQAEIYRCEVNGEVTFSQTPCGEGATEYKLNYSRPDESREATPEPEEPEPDTKAGREAAALGHAIEQEEALITDLEMRRDVELRKLEGEIDELSEAEVIAGREDALNTRMEAVNQRYEALIEEHRLRIERINEEIDTLSSDAEQ